MLRFKDGQYIYEEDLTEKFRDSLIDVKEYMNNEKIKALVQFWAKNRDALLL